MSKSDEEISLSEPDENMNTANQEILINTIENLIATLETTRAHDFSENEMDSDIDNTTSNLETTQEEEEINKNNQIQPILIDGKTYQDEYFSIFVARPYKSHSLKRYPLSLHADYIEVKDLVNKPYVISITISPKYEMNWAEDIWFSIEGFYEDEPIKLSDHKLYHKNSYALTGTKIGQHSSFIFYQNTELENKIDSLKTNVTNITLKVTLHKRLPKLNRFKQLEKELISKRPVDVDLEEEALGEIEDMNKLEEEIDRLHPTKMIKHIVYNKEESCNYYGRKFINPFFGNVTNNDFTEITTKEYKLALSPIHIEDNKLIIQNHKFVTSRLINNLATRDKVLSNIDILEAELLMLRKNRDELSSIIKLDNLRIQQLNSGD